MKEQGSVSCPLEYGLEVFGGKWKPRIICVLYGKGTLRYHELSNELVNITNKVLSSALKELVSDGIVLRTEVDSIPPKVEYSLTEKGISVVPILKSIADWAGMHVNCSEESTPLCKKCSYGVIDADSLVKD